MPVEEGSDDDEEDDDGDDDELAAGLFRGVLGALGVGVCAVGLWGLAGGGLVSGVLGSFPLRLDLHGSGDLGRLGFGVVSLTSLLIWLGLVWQDYLPPR